MPILQFALEIMILTLFGWQGSFKVTLNFHNGYLNLLHFWSYLSKIGDGGPAKHLPRKRVKKMGGTTRHLGATISPKLETFYFKLKQSSKYFMFYARSEFVR